MRGWAAEGGEEEGVEGWAAGAGEEEATAGGVMGEVADAAAVAEAAVVAAGWEQGAPGMAAEAMGLEAAKLEGWAARMAPCSLAAAGAGPVDGAG